MKKIAIIMLLALTLASCTNKEANETNNKTKNNEVKTDIEAKEEQVVKATDTITVTYTGSLEDGTVFDASSKHPGQDLSFEVGVGKVIPGFDNGVLGMKLGETRTINIDAKDAYGESNELLLKDEDFAAIAKGGLNKEDMVVGINKIGELGEIEILRIEGDDYYAKHPSDLAGKNLIFEVTIDKITPFVKKEVVSNGDTISVIYTGKLDDGTVFDSNKDNGKPTLDFVAGAGQMIPGFDAAVIGMKLDETKTVTILAKDAYGEKTGTGSHELAGKDLTFEITVKSIK